MKKKAKMLARNRVNKPRSRTEPTRTSLRAADQARHEKRLATERHLGMTIEDWRVKKRQEWRAVMDAIRRFDFGSAYTPVGHDLFDVHRAVNRINDTLDVDWVCW